MAVKARSPRRSLRGAIVLVAVFIASRIVFYAVGLRFDARALKGQVDYLQLLDLRQLKHHLIESIWYLHSQPPLFNFATGLLLHLPPSAVEPAAIAVGMALGLVMVLSCYYLCLELHLPQWLALMVGVLVIFDPADVLYQNWYFYSFPTAVTITFAALCIARYVRTRSLSWGVGYFASLMAVVLMNSTFQWIWFVVAIAPVAVVLRYRWRSVLVAAVVPVLVVGGLYVKNAIVFGTSTTSSWFGMNLANVTLAHASPQQIRKLLAEKGTSPIGDKLAFQALGVYARDYRPHAATGVTVLDQRLKSDGLPNLNNVDYIAISSEYTRDDLRYIEDDPTSYAHDVAQGAELFFRPQEQYFFLWPGAQRLSGYVRPYDVLIDWQPHAPNYASIQVPAGRTTIVWPLGKVTAASWDQMSLSAVAIYALVLLVSPFVVWRRRNRSSYAAALAFIWISSAYVFVVANVSDLGENMRFRYDLGPLPLVAAAAVVVALVRRGRGKRHTPIGTVSDDDERPRPAVDAPVESSLV